MNLFENSKFIEINLNKINSYLYKKQNYHREINDYKFNIV